MLKVIEKENLEKVQVILKNGKTSPMPKNIEPMLATLVNEPIEEQGWLYEMKWDGYRAIAYMNNGTVDICSRNNKSFNKKFYPLQATLKEWNINAVTDGEIVVVNEEGVPDFGSLQQWRSEADGQLFYYLFDILWLEGKSVMHLPLEERRTLLKAIVPANKHHIRLSQSMVDNGKEAFAQGGLGRNRDGLLYSGMVEKGQSGVI